MAYLVYKQNADYCVFSDKRRKHWIRIGNVDKKTAKQILKRLEIERILGRLNITDSQKITLFEFIEKYLDYSRVNKSETSYNRECEVIRHFKRFFGNPTLDKITTERIEEYKSLRVKEGMKPATVNKELAVLRFMLRKAVEWNYLRDNPFKGIKMLKVTKQPVRFLTQEEIDRLIECASLWLKPILIVLRNTGLRRHELLNLRWKDIDFDNKTILVTSRKTNSFRIIPMNQELYQTLLWLKDNYPLPYMDKTIPRQVNQMDYVFCHPNGNTLKEFKRSFYNACRKAGIKAYPHLFRHTFASHLVMNGVDLVSVKELLGHTNITTTMIYAHLSPSYKANTVERLPWSKPKIALVKNSSQS